MRGWLATTTGPRSRGGDHTRTSISLYADGTGSQTWTTVREYIDYGMGNESSKETFTWWSKDGKLVMDDAPWEVVATPNCRLVKMMDLVFTHTPKGPCPGRIAPLTETEAKMIGRWSFHEEGGAGESNEYLTLWIEADRNVYYRYSPHTSWMSSSAEETHTSYFNVDSDGVLHGMNIDGTEDFNVRLQRADNGLSFCDFLRPEKCRPLEKE